MENVGYKRKIQVHRQYRYCHFFFQMIMVKQMAIQMTDFTYKMLQSTLAFITMSMQSICVVYY